MKLATMLGMILFTSSVSAQTVINYEDGSTYTLKENQEIYISSSRVYKASGSIVSSLRFAKIKPWERRDYVAPVYTGEEECWPWGGVAPPKGYSLEACYEEQEEQEEQPCDELGFGGTCQN